MLVLLRIDFVYITLGELPERALCVSKLLSHFFLVERLFTDYIGPLMFLQLAGQPRCTLEQICHRLFRYDVLLLW